MLRKYMSDRGKIRARRVSGNCTQHQRDVAIAIKTARELVLLPYTQRTTTERPGGRGGGRGREGGYGGQGGAGRGRRDEERSLSADATSTALADDAPRVVPGGDIVIEEVVDVTGTGDGTVTEAIVEDVEHEA
jgi:small subunit ribosomal protein S18